MMVKRPLVGVRRVRVGIVELCCGCVVVWRYAKLEPGTIICQTFYFVILPSKFLPPLRIYICPL
jgi:hypothetical protein